MKTVEEIHGRTPVSRTQTDNPIGLIIRDATVLMTGPEVKDGTLIDIHKDDEYRHIHKGCEMGAEITAFRYGDRCTIWVPNSCVEIIYGYVKGLTPREETVDQYPTV